MLSELSLDGTTLFVLVALMLILIGVVVDSARILATSAAAALRGLTRAMGALVLVTLASALMLVVVFVR